MARILRVLALVSATASALLLGSVSSAWADTVFSPVTITTTIDFSKVPFQGTFSVPVGRDVLGCSAGTFVDRPVSIIEAQVLSRSAIERDLTCGSGAGSGSSFRIVFLPNPEPGPGIANGQWEVLPVSGFFANLRGGGDFSLLSVVCCPPTGHELLTGMIQFIP